LELSQEIAMRRYIFTVIAVFSLASGALAQGAGGGSGSPPREIGNRANGYDYQPTPSELAPREKAAGIVPPAAQQRAENQELDRIDRELLQSEGLSTKSVPKLKDGQ
jgi:hypothetical protein